MQVALVYFVAEMLGALAGYGLLKWLIPRHIEAQTMGDSYDGMCVTVLHTDFSEWHGVVVEFIATGVLILLCCACWDPRNAQQTDSLPLKFGFAVTTLSITFVSDFNRSQRLL